ncbi:MAG TPA: ROK family protein [Bacteroidales bacterium]|nr:ROK family protein [Bacteroidales bacterium]
MREVVAGIDIGGTNIVFGLVDRHGEIVAHDTLVTTEYPVFDDYVEAQSKALKKLLSQNSDLKLLSVGIGAPNANYYKGTIELAPNLLWKGIVPLGNSIGKSTGVPVAVTNDANAAAVGELVFGGGKEMKDFIVLTLGTGLGSGIVINRQVVYGHSGFAGELGHMTVVPGGRMCGCGLRGHLETYASATGLVRTVLELLSIMREDSPLRNVPPSEITSRMIAEYAAANDSVAVKAIEYTAEMLGFGIVNSIIFSSPEAVFLFGGLAQAGEMLFKPVRDYVEKNLMPVFRGTCTILPSAIPSNNAAVLGAAALAWNELDNT